MTVIAMKSFLSLESLISLDSSIKSVRRGLTLEVVAEVEVIEDEEIEENWVDDEEEEEEDKSGECSADSSVSISVSSIFDFMVSRSV